MDAIITQMLAFSVVTTQSSRLFKLLKAHGDTALLLWSLWVAAVVTYLCGFLGLLYPPLVLIVLLPLATGLHALRRLFLVASKYPMKTKIGLSLVVFIWVMHAVQVFTPETGFDALWYHLPVARENVLAHQFVFQPALYQSANPLFSDSLLTVGFMGAGVFGAKLLAYMIGLGLVAVTYRIALLFVSRDLAVATTVLVSTFQVIAWQSASFYIDVAVALWLCGAIWYTLLFLQRREKNVALAVGLLLGAAVASKLFLVVLPAVLFFSSFLVRDTQTKKFVGLVCVVSYSLAAPMYIFAWKFLGHPFYSLVHHTESIAAIGSEQTLQAHLVQRTQDTPHFLWQIGISRDYTTPLLLLFFPLVVWALWRGTMQAKHKLLLFFSVILLALWWYIPPLSTRYGLGGFITATIFTVSQLEVYFAKKTQFVIWVVVGLALISLTPRVFVVDRSMQYLTGGQTKREYLTQFLDGNIDAVLKNWYSVEFAE